MGRSYFELLLLWSSKWCTYKWWCCWPHVRFLRLRLLGLLLRPLRAAPTALRRPDVNLREIGGSGERFALFL
jgi:hypothetical protein